MAIGHQLKIGILVSKWVILKYLVESLINLKFIDNNNKNELDDVVFLVTGERHEPFFMLQGWPKDMIVWCI